MGFHFNFQVGVGLLLIADLLFFMGSSLRTLLPTYLPQLVTRVMAHVGKASFGGGSDHLWYGLFSTAVFNNGSLNEDEANAHRQIMDND